MTQHTPGPWMARAMGGHSVVLAQAPPAQNRRVPVAYGYKPENGYSIALPFTYEERDGSTQTRGDFVEFSHADAKLIAAAPDLKEVCSAQATLIASAQAILTTYLVPDGIDAEAAIGRLLALLDGPEERRVKALRLAAIAKATDRGTEG